MADILESIWACMNCNTTFKLGQMRSGPLYNDPLRCPHCDSGNTSPADGTATDVPKYYGEIGTKN